MNAIRQQVIAAAVLSALGAAVQADDITPDTYRELVSTLSRAEVVAERDKARIAGDLRAFDGEDSGSFHLARAQLPSTLSRAQVKAEVLAARADGTLGALSGEDSGSFAFARSVPVTPSTYAAAVARAH